MNFETDVKYKRDSTNGFNIVPENNNYEMKLDKFLTKK